MNQWSLQRKEDGKHALSGKTATAVQILRSWAMLGLKPLLAVADGNIAVDNIAASRLYVLCEFSGAHPLSP